MSIWQENTNGFCFENPNPPSASVSSPEASDVFGNLLDTPEGIDEVLASFSSQKPPSELKIIEQRHAPRYRVKWKAEIVADDKRAYQGFINDISTIGASICLDKSLHTTKCTLRIFAPPLSSVNKPHLIEVTGRFVYMVFDGRLQLYRLAISFVSFHQDSDGKFLEDRLTRHHSQIPEY